MACRSGCTGDPPSRHLAPINDPEGRLYIGYRRATLWSLSHGVAQVNEGNTTMRQTQSPSSSLLDAIIKAMNSGSSGDTGQGVQNALFGSSK